MQCYPNAINNETPKLQPRAESAFGMALRLFRTVSPTASDLSDQSYNTRPAACVRVTCGIYHEQVLDPPAAKYFKSPSILVQKWIDTGK